MTSVLTNNDASSALAVLRKLAVSSTVTSRQASTGLRVSKASDDAAYWSVSMAMKQQRSANATVQDAISLGSGVVDVAADGMDQTLDILNRIKDKLVLANEPSADRTEIQSEIGDLANQAKAVAAAASFDGVNLLSTDVTAISDDSSATGRSVGVPASTGVSSSGSLTIGSIDIDTLRTSLFNSDSGGLLDGDPRDPGSVGGIRSGDEGVSATGTTLNLDFSAFRVYDDVTVGLSLTVNGSTRQVEIDRSTVDAALGTSDGKVKTAADMVKVLQSVVSASGLTASANTDGSVKLASSAGATLPHGATRGIAFSAVAVNIEPIQKVGLSQIDVAANPDQLANYLSNVQRMIDGVTSGAAMLGAVKNRLDAQSTYIDALDDNLTKGIGSLVDADMEQTAAALSAQQVRGALALKSLQIANSQPSIMLRLFKR